MKKLIIILSALTITSSITPLAVACNKEKPKKLDLSEITADMIINWKKKYTFTNQYTNGQKTIDSEKLGTLKNDEIVLLIEQNLVEIIKQKISEVDKMKMHDFDELNVTEISKLFISNNIINFLIMYDVKLIDEQNSKKFIADIALKKWDEVNINNNSLKEWIDKTHTSAESFLNLSEIDKKAKIINDNPTMKSADQIKKKLILKLKYKKHH